jgi:hypothetical protein
VSAHCVVVHWWVCTVRTVPHCARLSHLLCTHSCATEGGLCCELRMLMICPAKSRYDHLPNPEVQCM